MAPPWHTHLMISFMKLLSHPAGIHYTAFFAKSPATKLVEKIMRCKADSKLFTRLRLCTTDRAQVACSPGGGVFLEGPLKNPGVIHPDALVGVPSHQLSFRVVGCKALLAGDAGCELHPGRLVILQRHCLLACLRACLLACWLASLLAGWLAGWLAGLLAVPSQQARWACHPAQLMQECCAFGTSAAALGVHIISA